MDALLATLRSEFEAEQGSFLLQLRCDLRWDPAAFARATRAMYAYVQQGPFETIPRWIADGFWYMDWFVGDWSAHPNFPRQYPSAYYADAIQLLHDLANWLFSGESPTSTDLHLPEP